MRRRGLYSHNESLPHLAAFLQILDLLDGSPTKEKLDIRQTPDGNVVAGLKEVVVRNFDAVIAVIASLSLIVTTIHWWS